MVAVVVTAYFAGTNPFRLQPFIHLPGHDSYLGAQYTTVFCASRMCCIELAYTLR